MTGERKGVQDGNTIPGSSISRSSYELGIHEATNNQLVTQTLVFPRCRLVRDFLIPELSYYKALLPLPHPFASFLLAVAVASAVYEPNRITSPIVTFSVPFIPYIPLIIFVHKFLLPFFLPLSPASLYHAVSSGSVIFHRIIKIAEKLIIARLNDFDI